MTLSALDLAIVAGYFALVVAVGYWASRRIGNFLDFMVAGRLLTAPVLAGTFVATFYGLEATFGAPETSYSEGISTFFVYAAPYYLFYMILAFWIAPRAIATGAATVPEMMERFYGPGARLPVSLVTAFYSLPLLSVYGLGVLGHFFLGLDPFVAAAIGGAIAVVYTILGGLLADALTDAIQFVIMCVTVALAAAWAMVELGTYSQLAARLDPDYFRPLGPLSTADILVYASVALVPLVDPGLYQRIFAARTVRDIRVALVAATLLWWAFDWLVVYFGILGAWLVATGQLAGTVNPTEIILHIVSMVLPAGLLGLFVAGCLATAMSTIDSYAIIASSAIVYDAVHKWRKGGLSEKALLLWSRVGIAVAVAVSLFVAFRFERIRDAWIANAALLVAALLVPLLAGFAGRVLSPRAGTWACWAGFGAALLLIVLVETVGTPEPELASRSLTLPGLGVKLIREHIMLVAVPLSALAFCAGLLRDAGR